MTATESEIIKSSDFATWAENTKRGREIVQALIDRIAADQQVTVVSGGATGPDTWATERATELNLATVVVRPNWKKYGKRAGFERNKEIVAIADDVIAFWDQVSRGTDDTIAKAFKARKPLAVFGPSGQLIFAVQEEDYETLTEIKLNNLPKMAIPKGR